MKFSKKKRTMRRKKMKKQTKRRRYKMRGGSQLTEDQTKCLRDLRATLPNGNVISFDGFIDEENFDIAANEYFKEKGINIDQFCKNPNDYNIADIITNLKAMFIMEYL